MSRVPNALDPDALNAPSAPVLPSHGFGKFQVPEMPSYVGSYTSRGNSAQGATAPVRMQTRWGNPRYQGGMAAYVSEAESPGYFEGYREKKGNHGVFVNERWSVGHDARGNFGIAALDAGKNYVKNTRGGNLRAGGPKRSDYISTPMDECRPGIATSRVPQNNGNYVGVFESRKRSPQIATFLDPLPLRQMIEHNPFHISSHSAAQAKELYDADPQVPELIRR